MLFKGGGSIIIGGQLLSTDANAAEGMHEWGCCHQPQIVLIQLTASYHD